MGNPDMLQFVGSQRATTEQQKLIVDLHFTNYFIFIYLFYLFIF